MPIPNPFSANVQLDALIHQLLPLFPPVAVSLDSRTPNPKPIHEPTSFIIRRTTLTTDLLPPSTLAISHHFHLRPDQHINFNGLAKKNPRRRLVCAAGFGAQALSLTAWRISACMIITLERIAFFGSSFSVVVVFTVKFQPGVCCTVCVCVSVGLCTFAVAFASTYTYITLQIFCTEDIHTYIHTVHTYPPWPRWPCSALLCFALHLRLSWLGLPWTLRANNYLYIIITYWVRLTLPYGIV